MSDHTFCRLLLQGARKTAKKAHIPPLHPWKILGDWEVRWANDGYWHGSACCAYEAKAKAVFAILDAKERRDERRTE